MCILRSLIVKRIEAVSSQRYAVKKNSLYERELTRSQKAISLKAVNVIKAFKGFSAKWNLRSLQRLTVYGVDHHSLIHFQSDNFSRNFSFPVTYENFRINFHKKKSCTQRIIFTLLKEKIIPTRNRLHYGDSVAFAVCVCVFLAFSYPAQASSPALTAKQKELQQLQQKIEETQSQHALTQVQLRRFQHDVTKAQEEIITKAAEVSRIEKDLTKQQREVQNLFEQEARRNQEISAYKTQISHLVSAAWSIQYRPQLAAWLLPEETRERALSSRALHMTTLSLKQQMDHVNDSLRELQELRQKIVLKQQQNETMQEQLRAERKALQETMKRQQQSIGKLQKDEVSYSQTITDLTKASASLETLIGKLEVAREVQREKKENAYPSRLKKPSEKTASATEDRPKAVSFLAAKGALPLPAEGIISGVFGERRGNNDRLKGLEMQTLQGALVTAPYESEVLFTGTFLDYGKMVILRHSREYHTLVAGLSRIDVSVGQFLLDGEPIGAMGESRDKRNLYLELRKSSQAINPLPWFAVQKHHYAKR
jgi:murein hydrolase activator